MSPLNERRSQQSARRRGWGPTPSALGVLGLALFALAQMTAIFHFAIVRHDICEHGELVEHYPGAPDDHDHRTDGSDRDASADRHDHCHSMLSSGGCGMHPPPTDLLGDVLFVVLDSTRPVEHGTRDLRPLDRLDVAPKTSPPTA